MAPETETRVLVLDAGALRFRRRAESDRPLRFSDESASRTWLHGVAPHPGALRTLRSVVVTVEPGHDHRSVDDDTVVATVARALARGRLCAAVAATYTANEASDVRTESAAPAPAGETGLTWIAIRLVDDSSPPQPVPNERFAIVVADGSTREGRLDQNGYALVDGIDPGRCEVTFPDLHRSDWKQL